MAIEWFRWYINTGVGIRNGWSPYLLPNVGSDEWFVPLEQMCGTVLDR